MSEIKPAQEQQESQKALEIVRDIRIADATEFGFTPEQQAALKKVVEDATKIFMELIEEIRKALAIVLEAFRDIWKAYLRARPYNGRWARRQNEYWFLWSQRKLLLIE